MILPESSPPLSPGLYLVATPIGNLRDITLRALDVLQAADVIYCEDTRQTAKLLQAYGIKTRTTAYHDHSDDHVRQKIIDRLKENKVVALVSDAGMPLISDPGYKLVQNAYTENLPVTSLPGANAPLTAIQLSGLPCDQFVFLGFLPPKSAARQKVLKAWMETSATLVFYEAKQRVLKSLQDIGHVLGSRQVAVVRELTKKFEEVLRGSVEDVLSILEQREEIKGEFVILIGASEDPGWSEERVCALIKMRLSDNLPVKQLSEEIASQCGWGKKDAYQLILDMKSAG